MVTPGTVTEPGLLPGDSNNYLASVILNERSASVSYADITTGEFAVTELPLEALRAELTRLHPAEILHPDNQTLNDGHSRPPDPLPCLEIRARQMRRDAARPTSKHPRLKGSASKVTVSPFALRARSFNTSKKHNPTR